MNRQTDVNRERRRCDADGVIAMGIGTVDKIEGEWSLQFQFGGGVKH